MGLSLGQFTEIMDKVFGGATNRGLIQGIVLLVVGIILDVIPAVATAAAAASAAAYIITNPTMYYQILAGAAALGFLYIIGDILITLGVVGLIWWFLRKMEWVTE